MTIIQKNNIYYDGRERTLQAPAYQDLGLEQGGFDEQTKQKIQAYLEEIDAKRQQQQQSSSLQQTKYIKFVHDKELKLLSFTGKFDKMEVPTKDFETGLVIPEKYVTRYSFECYDFTNPDQSIRIFNLAARYKRSQYSAILSLKEQNNSGSHSQRSAWIKDNHIPDQSTIGLISKD
jgi:hypothetical protein